MRRIVLPSHRKEKETAFELRCISETQFFTLGSLFDCQLAMRFVFIDFNLVVFSYFFSFPSLFRLFEEHQELLALFKKFHNLTTRDEQANSTELAEHAVSVMTTLDESIRSLDNIDTFLLYLHQVGQTHYKIQGFKKEYFWVSLNLSRFISK